MKGKVILLVLACIFFVVASAGCVSPVENDQTLPGDDPQVVGDGDVKESDDQTVKTDDGSGIQTSGDQSVKFGNDMVLQGSIT